jgi:hypothetical protein
MDASRMEEPSMSSSAEFRPRRLSRRGVLGGLAIAPSLARAQATDSPHADDISAMPIMQVRHLGKPS